MARSLLLLASALCASVIVAACTGGTDDGAATPTPSGSPTPTNAPTPLPITVPATFTGSLTDAGDHDLYSLTVSGGDPVVLDVDAEALTAATGLDGSQLDARLIIYDPDGNLLSVLDDGTTVANPARMKDPFVVFSPQVPGTYTIRVEDAYGGGGPAGYDYRLLASRPAPANHPGGENCGAAVLLTSLDGAFTSTVADSTNTFGGTATALPCVGSVVPAKDHLYKMVLDAGTRLQIVRSGDQWDGAVYVTTSCGNAYAVVAPSCLAGGNGSEDADGVVFTAAVTGTHFLFVDGVVSGAFGPYRLDVRTFPPGE